MKKRHIELEVVTTSTDNVFFKVKNNKRNSIFNDGQNYFNASNHISIHSVDYPAWNGKNMLCVLGENHKLDDMILTASHEDFEKIKQAVDEYNVTDRKGYKKPWPQIGDKFYIVESCGEVVQHTFDECLIDLELKNIGNFYQTFEEASKVAKKIKLLFKNSQ